MQEELRKQAMQLFSFPLAAGAAGAVEPLQTAERKTASAVKPATPKGRKVASKGRKRSVTTRRAKSAK